MLNGLLSGNDGAGRELSLFMLLSPIVGIFYVMILLFITLAYMVKRKRKRPKKKKKTNTNTKKKTNYKNKSIFYIKYCIFYILIKIQCWSVEG